LEKDIHTNKQNFTRFLVLSSQNVISSKNNKSSVCFEIAHRSGSLADVPGIWAETGINLTKIQSVPIIGKPYQYWFYVDLEWSNEELYRRAMYMVMRHVIGLSILGEYEQQTYSIQKINKAG
jgi:prephenate dehydratase